MFSRSSVECLAVGQIIKGQMEKCNQIGNYNMLKTFYGNWTYI